MARREQVKRRRKKMDWFLCPGTRKAIHSWCGGGGERKSARENIVILTEKIIYEGESAKEKDIAFLFVIFLSFF